MDGLDPFRRTLELSPAEPSDVLDVARFGEHAEAAAYIAISGWYVALRHALVVLLERVERENRLREDPPCTTTSQTTD